MLLLCLVLCLCAVSVCWVRVLCLCAVSVCCVSVCCVYVLCLCAVYVCCVAPVFYPAQCFALIRALSAVFVPKTGANLRGRPPRTTPTANIQVGLYMVGLYTAHHASAIRQALAPSCQLVYRGPPRPSTSRCRCTAWPDPRAVTACVTVCCGTVRSDRAVAVPTPRTPPIHHRPGIDRVRAGPVRGHGRPDLQLQEGACVLCLCAVPVCCDSVL